MKKPELTDEEIRSHMRFDKLLQAYKDGGPATSPRKWFFTTGYIVSTVLIISAALYFLLPSSFKVNKNNAEPLRTSTLDTAGGSQKQEAIRLTPNIEPQQETPTSLPNVSTKKEGQKNPRQADVEKKSVLSQFTEAEPIDGYSTLYEYFDRELKYPIDAAQDSLEGIVTVSFAIDQHGKPGFIKIENSLGTMFDQECQRVINSMPMWKPATLNGKPIATRLSIPLTFKLKK